ncbi:hypothetical protein MYCTH_2300296 [Thermothelomyces thermophilus ATCC 42464]|uniref:GPI anchored protein n=1 Tax=Thermothelomyces thermophilus (strain ATCC 42464 / BCRC 31852 / DSM 1799) TaxID=573729 RepID=G2QB06_THET4|nr:uncharacterized protein MYCTH_2300296 [Thermothelomyces thermophilus ATCC 42464]AEO55944.1 hypothetical protein MYCTH_2300296 [Thermothelomyces thermophilus ATCC 42464]
MPADRGAKFHHEYCAFGDHTTFAPASSRPHAPTAAAIAARSLHDADDARRLWANASAELSLRPPFALLSEPEIPEKDESIAPAWSLFRRAASALALLEKRQWACPSGTSSCSSIGFPNSCCGQDETCVEVPDTGLGPVGCCPSGATCSGGISDCADGSTACGSSIGGGCCIPGFVCMGVGCVRYSSSSSPPPAATPTTLTTTSTRIVSDPTRSTILVTVTTTVTPSGPPVTSTVIETTTASSTRSGGGAGAPFRPTSSPQPSGSNTRTTGTGAYCPTGFYPCLARAGGGCCQTGRDCAVTTCPPPPQQSEITTIVNGNGVTVVVPADGAATTATATTTADGCAAGWFLCGRDAGPDAGCCPSGYECGTASCFREGAGATGASVAKELPRQSGSAGEARATAGWGLVVGIGMLWGVGWGLWV